MTIETGSSAQNTSRPAATEPKHAKGKPGDAHGHGAGAPGGFMAILASLDTSEAAPPTTGLMAGSGLPGNGPGAIALAALAHAAEALKGTRQPADAASDVDASATEGDLGKLLQGSAADLSTAAAGALPTPSDVQFQRDVAIDTSALFAQAAQWSAVPVATTEPATPGLVAGGGANLAMAAKLPQKQAKPEGAAVVCAATGGDTATELAVTVGKAKTDVFARLASAQAAMSAPAEASSPATDARQAQLLQKTAEIPITPIATALAAANTATPARHEDAAKERSVFRSNVSEGSSAVGQSYMQSASSASSIAAPDPVTPTDTYVAEKVAYWITNDVQNAEMKLDGIGDKPVEVSIRMQGNEAHISFRSDELQARAALENASVHLKDMLQREGLVLSGVSVGTSGTGDSGAQDRQSRQGARQSGVVSVQPARTDRASGTGRVSGGALDLFV
jgi:flagellar hook-length control protein FliK